MNYASESAGSAWLEKVEHEIDRHVDAMADDLVAWRRHFHAHPEPSGRERRTSEWIAEQLQLAGLRPRLLKDGVGVVAEFPEADGRAPRSWIAVRADIDALMMEDRKQTPYASTVPGVAHACGHDAHTAIVLGVASVLASVSKEALTERGALGQTIGVRFLFQPAEETGEGASWLIDEGLLRNVAAIVGVHVEPNLAAGRVGIRYGVLTAYCDEVTIRITGRGGHSARPYLTNDTIAVAAQLVTLLYQSVPRWIDARDPAVLTFGSVVGGRAANVIPDLVELRGTLRSLDGRVHERLQKYIHRTCRGLEQISDAQIELSFHDALPGVRNDPEVTRVVQTACERVLASENVIQIEKPSMGAEDFALYLDHAPGMQLRLGCAGSTTDWPPLHSPVFDIDERCLTLGVRILSRSVVMLAENAAAAGVEG